jgi:hypothetical protein
MSYNFDIVGVTPILSFFNYQQRHEQNPKRGKTYIGSYKCTLDAFIESTKIIHRQPNWNWDEVINTIINFWLKHEDKIQYWKQELTALGGDNIIVARVVNFDILRTELESLFEV